ncbi:hypothetical protein BDQ12DRAFT_682736 [Crucibulum laeve]|uniref:Uncharacterized protein n=1 Tax=Crucibulum laeve TaxID=68775 RepID=A0A5C3M0I1_9AGAR|nr:hypothetical protein BDQ12DRAFT_682736 [Crucibulum laeve]
MIAAHPAKSLALPSSCSRNTHHALTRSLRTASNRTSDSNALPRASPSLNRTTTPTTPPEFPLPSLSRFMLLENGGNFRRADPRPLLTFEEAEKERFRFNRKPPPPQDMAEDEVSLPLPGVSITGERVTLRSAKTAASSPLRAATESSKDDGFLFDGVNAEEEFRDSEVWDVIALNDSPLESEGPSDNRLMQNDRCNPYGGRDVFGKSSSRLSTRPPTIPSFGNVSSVRPKETDIPKDETIGRHSSMFNWHSALNASKSRVHSRWEASLHREPDDRIYSKPGYRTRNKPVNRMERFEMDLKEQESMVGPLHIVAIANEELKPPQHAAALVEHKAQRVKKPSSILSKPTVRNVVKPRRKTSQPRELEYRSQCSEMELKGQECTSTKEMEPIAASSVETTPEELPLVGSVAETVPRVESVPMKVPLVETTDVQFLTSSEGNTATIGASTPVQTKQPHAAKQGKDTKSTKKKSKETKEQALQSAILSRLHARLAASDEK